MKLHEPPQGWERPDPHIPADAPLDSLDLGTVGPHLFANARYHASGVTGGKAPAVSIVQPLGPRGGAGVGGAAAGTTQPPGDGPGADAGQPVPAATGAACANAAAVPPTGQSRDANRVDVALSRARSLFIQELVTY